jgi:hypothetical protein
MKLERHVLHPDEYSIEDIYDEQCEEYEYEYERDTPTSDTDKNEPSEWVRTRLVAKSRSKFKNPLVTQNKVTDKHERIAKSSQEPSPTGPHLSFLNPTIESQQMTTSNRLGMSANLTHEATNRTEQKTPAASNQSCSRWINQSTQ